MLCYNVGVYGYIRVRTLSVALGIRTLSFHNANKREVYDLANIKSAKKRIQVTAVKTMRNKAVKTQLKTEIKKYEAALESGDKAVAEAAYKAAVKAVDKAVNNGLLHKNNAARKKSALTLKLNKLA